LSLTGMPGERGGEGEKRPHGHCHAPDIPPPKKEGEREGKNREEEGGGNNNSPEKKGEGEERGKKGGANLSRKEKEVLPFVAVTSRQKKEEKEGKKKREPCLMGLGEKKKRKAPCIGLQFHRGGGKRLRWVTERGKNVHNH